jgi:elongation factor 2
LYATCGPLPEGLPEDIEGGVINAADPLVERARKLVEKYSWDVTEARKIWSFGPHQSGANILIDGTKGIQYMNEIKDSVVAGFQWVTYDGVLCGEPLRGVKFVITDAHLHADTIHRGPGQIIPASKSVFYGSQLLSNPRLLEPVFEVFVNCPSQHQSGVFNVLSQRRGQVVEVLETGIKAHLPVLESFGLTEALRGATAGNAFPSMSFSHWQLMPDDPLNSSNTQMKELITKVRKRKGLQLDIPSVDRFLDKL